MDPELDALLDRQCGVAGTDQIRKHLTRRGLEVMVNSGVLERIWRGIYCRGEPDDVTRLRGLDHACGTSVPVCLSTAAALHGFDTEEPADLHVLRLVRDCAPQTGLWCTGATVRRWSESVNVSPRRPHGRRSRSRVAFAGLVRWRRWMPPYAAGRANASNCPGLLLNKRVGGASSRFAT
jgi:hypothetical protein